MFRAQVKESALGSTRSTSGSHPPLTGQALGAALAQKANFPGGLLANLFSGEPRAAVQRFAATYSRPSLTWENLPFLRRLAKLPIVLKGVLHADDARRALDAGVDGLVVSNHGGRQIDGEIASLDALPGVVDAVGGKIPVLFDSGVRGSADMFKALVLGARAVLLGRPCVYGLALAGEAGVREVVANALAEFDLTLGLAGCRSVREISASTLQKSVT